LSRPLSVRGCIVSSFGTSGLFSSVSASGVCLLPCQVCRTIVCLSCKLPGTSPRALLLGGRYSSGLVTCRCLAPEYHAWLVEVRLCMTLSCKDVLLKKKKNSWRKDDRVRGCGASGWHSPACGPCGHAREASQGSISQERPIMAVVS
jgi:hypothetical protein